MDALEALTTRHSVLRFKPKPVEPDKIRAMLEAAIENLMTATPVGYPDEPPKERPAQELLDVVGFKRGDSLALTRLLRGKLPLEQVLHRNRW